VTAQREALGRAGWHRRTAVIPLAYLAGTVVIAFAHPFLPRGRWLLVHLVLLGAVTNAILVWGTHFAAAVLRSPAARRRAETTRLVVLNAGIVAVLIGGGRGPAALGVAGAALVFAAITAHLASLARKLRRALPARFSITVHFYLASAVALLAGIPAGAWMLVHDDNATPRLLLFHTHVNLLGFVTLAVLGTLLTLWPTMLRTRMLDSARPATVRALPLGIAGVCCLGVGVLAWWPLVAAAGLALFAAGVLVTAVPVLATARQRPPASFATWSVLAGLGWLLVGLIADAVNLLTAANPTVAADRFGTVLLPLGGGFAAQVLIGAMCYLLPMALGGGPVAVRERTARLDVHAAQRVTMTNLALAVYLLPVPPFVRITTALLFLAALIQFLVPATRILATARRAS
jgi:hypothetical protein